MKEINVLDQDATISTRDRRVRISETTTQVVSQDYSVAQLEQEKNNNLTQISSLEARNKTIDILLLEIQLKIEEFEATLVAEPIVDQPIL
jgi:wobble nucleotide-excising tRNase